MGNDAPPMMWLILVVGGAVAIGGMLAWATLRYRGWLQGTARLRLRPTDDLDASASTRERTRHWERQIEAERGPEDPGPVQPRDLRAVLVIGLAAVIAGALVLGGMFLDNTRYDGTSSQPISERR